MKNFFLVACLLLFIQDVLADPLKSKSVAEKGGNSQTGVPYIILLKNKPLAKISGYKTFQINSSNDDASEIQTNGTVLVDDWAIQLGYNTGRSEQQIVGLRFSNVDIPKQAIIKSAYLRFFTNNADSTGQVNFTITGEASDDSQSFEEVVYNISNRPRTTASAQWSPPDWTIPWISKEEHRSSDISNIIKEIVSRQGFVSGNAITIFIEGSGANMRSFYAYDYTLTYPDRVRFARLIIEYEQPKQSCTFTPSILSDGSPEFLPDYSYAGYRWGTTALPNPVASTPGITSVDVTSYGAVANDEHDDTEAIQNAINAHANTPGTVMLNFPAGRFLLSDVILIERSNFILRGAGSGSNGTIFKIDNPMETLGIVDIDPAVRAEEQYDKYRDVISILNEYEEGVWPTVSGVPYSLFSWTGGFFYTRYDGNRYSRQTIADVTTGVKRGDSVFTIENPSLSLHVGDVVRFEWANPPGNDFLNYLVGSEPVTIGARLSGEDSAMVAQPVTITGVDGNQITIREPLLHDVSSQWTARLRTVYFNENVGFENFSIEFPATAEYGGHHLEDGYNGLFLTDLQHSWVRNVAFHNADSGIIMNHCKNNTVTGVRTSGREGHYTMYIGRSYGILTEDFDFQSPALHNPSFNTDSVLSVFSNGSIHTAKLDQHNGLNHQNLFDNIKVRYTPDLFIHGGNDDVLPTAAMYNTFWNIEVQELPYNNLVGTCEDAPGARLIGLHSQGNTLTVGYSPNPYVEGLNRCLAVPSLYEYQLQGRQN